MAESSAFRVCNLYFLDPSGGNTIWQLMACMAVRDPSFNSSTAELTLHSALLRRSTFPPFGDPYKIITEVFFDSTNFFEEITSNFRAALNLLMVSAKIPAYVWHRRISWAA